MVVFDLDDTLYKERDYVASGHIAVAEYIDKYRPGYDINGLWDDDILRVYREHSPDIELDVDGLKAIMALKDYGIAMGIITDGRTVSQRNKIRALGLDRFILPFNIVISEELGFDKTSSVPFERIMELNPTEQQFVYIGDNPSKDFCQPNLLGWSTVMLIDNNSINIHPQIMPEQEAYRPNEIVSSIYDYINKNILRC